MATVSFPEATKKFNSVMQTCIANQSAVAIIHTVAVAVICGLGGALLAVGTGALPLAVVAVLAISFTTVAAVFARKVVLNEGERLNRALSQLTTSRDLELSRERAAQKELVDSLETKEFVTIESLEAEHQAVVRGLREQIQKMQEELDARPACKGFLSEKPKETDRRIRLIEAAFLISQSPSFQCLTGRASLDSA